MTREPTFERVSSMYIIHYFSREVILVLELLLKRSYSRITSAAQFSDCFSKEVMLVLQVLLKRSYSSGTRITSTAQFSSYFSKEVMNYTGELILVTRN